MSNVHRTPHKGNLSPEDDMNVYIRCGLEMARRNPTISDDPLAHTVA